MLNVLGIGVLPASDFLLYFGDILPKYHIPSDDAGQNMTIVVVSYYL